MGHRLPICFLACCSFAPVNLVGSSDKIQETKPTCRCSRPIIVGFAFLDHIGGFRGPWMRIAVHQLQALSGPFAHTPTPHDICPVQRLPVLESPSCTSHGQESGRAERIQVNHRNSLRATPLVFAGEIWSSQLFFVEKSDAAM